MLIVAVFLIDQENAEEIKEESQVFMKWVIKRRPRIQIHQAVAQHTENKKEWAAQMNASLKTRSAIHAWQLWHPNYYMIESTQFRIQRTRVFQVVVSETAE